MQIDFTKGIYLRENFFFLINLTNIIFIYYKIDQDKRNDDKPKKQLQTTLQKKIVLINQLILLTSGTVT